MIAFPNSLERLNLSVMTPHSLTIRRFRIVSKPFFTPTIITSRLVRCFALAGAPDGGLEVLLELVDSQITYRQRYVMVAARALVIDLAMLDPNNPRSVAFQLDRIETHLSALPGRHAAGRLSPVQQVATALATRLRTVEAAAIDEALIIDTEQSLMMLSDAITAAYLTNNERSEPAWEALA